MHSRSTVLLAAVILVLGSALQACDADDGDGDRISSRSYKGHETDRDSNAFVTAYPAALGTRLDDCQTCHKGGEFTYDRGGGDIRSTYKNACDYCHLIEHPDDSLIEAQPTTIAQTLNEYGAAYSAAGRSGGALRSIESADSDGDGHSNIDEIADLKYPGDPESMPGQQTAPLKTYGMGDLQALTAHDEFLLCNSHRQEFDNYSWYRGVKAGDLLADAGVDTSSPDFQGITVIAPDGYMKDFTAEDINNAFPAGLFFDNLGTDSLGTDCGFVQYPDVMPDGLVDGGEIAGEQWLMLAYERDGLAMDVSELDIESGKIDGEGPYRIIVPQSTPGSPDRGSKYSPTACADGWDYDDAKDHNAGSMVRGVIAIRVNPLPAGVEDFDYHYGGWAYVDSLSVIVYGFGVSGD